MDANEVKAERRRPPLAAGAFYAGAAAAGLLLIFWWFSAPGEEGLAVGGRAPEFSAADLTGRTVRLSEFRGKVVLLDFWATWCPSCVEEVPELKRLHGTLGPRGLELLAASVDEEGPQAVASFAAKERLPYRVLFADAPLARTYRVWGLPTKYLITSEGVIARKYIGEMDALEVEADIKNLLEKEKRRSS